jgi:hypothetical protein
MLREKVLEINGFRAKALGLGSISIQKVSAL